MKNKKSIFFVLCCFILILAQLACEYEIDPDNPKIYQPLLDFYARYLNFGNHLGFLPDGNAPPWIIEVSYDDENDFSPTITGRVPSNVNDSSKIRLYIVALMDCQEKFVKRDLFDEYVLSDILVNDDERIWEIENVDLPKDALFGATLLGLSLDGTHLVETNLSQMNINHSSFEIHFSYDPITDLISAAPVSITGSGGLENMCLQLVRDDIVEQETLVNKDGKWLFDEVSIRAGDNRFVVQPKLGYFLPTIPLEIEFESYAIEVEWPFGTMEKDVYLPDYQQGVITSWWGWNNYHVTNGYGFHRGIDIGKASGLKHADGTSAKIEDTEVRAVADGTVFFSSRLGCEGYSVGIDHGGWGSFYLHLSALEFGEIRSSEDFVEVKVGDPIGIIGDSGTCSDGTHLHLGVFTWPEGNENLEEKDCYNYFCGQKVTYINMNPVRNHLPLKNDGKEHDLDICEAADDIWAFSWRDENVLIHPDYETGTPIVLPSKHTKVCEP